LIEIRNASWSIGGKSILEDIELTIPKGGVTALIGPNGAGKSTLLSVVARLLPLSAGTVLIDGAPVHGMPTADVAKRLAIMPQQDGIATRLRVKELVSLGRFPHHRGRPASSDHQAVDEALELFELRQLASRFVDTLSGGERQRARVAMAYCQGTDYLLLDEPLNNLDIYYARQLMRMLRTVVEQRGKTVVIVLHDLNYASVYADHIVAMRAGWIAATGSRYDVIQTEVLKRIFGYSIAVERVGDVPLSLHFI